MNCIADIWSILHQCDQFVSDNTVSVIRWVIPKESKNDRLMLGIESFSRSWLMILHLWNVLQRMTENDATKRPLFPYRGIYLTLRKSKWIISDDWCQLLSTRQLDMPVQGHFLSITNVYASLHYSAILVMKRNRHVYIAVKWTSTLLELINIV